MDEPCSPSDSPLAHSIDGRSAGAAVCVPPSSPRDARVLMRKRSGRLGVVRDVHRILSQSETRAPSTGIGSEVRQFSYTQPHGARSPTNEPAKWGRASTHARRVEERGARERRRRRDDALESGYRCVSSEREIYMECSPSLTVPGAAATPCRRGHARRASGVGAAAQRRVSARTRALGIALTRKSSSHRLGSQLGAAVENDGAYVF